MWPPSFPASCSCPLLSRIPCPCGFFLLKHRPKPIFPSLTMVSYHSSRKVTNKKVQRILQAFILAGPCALSNVLWPPDCSQLHGTSGLAGGSHPTRHFCQRKGKDPWWNTSFTAVPPSSHSEQQRGGGLSGAQFIFLVSSFHTHHTGMNMKPRSSHYAWK